MNNYIKTLSIVLAFLVLTFSACKSVIKAEPNLQTKEETTEVSSKSEVSSLVEDIGNETSSVESAVESEQTEQKNEYNDLLFEMEDCGNELFAFGDLEAQEFSSALDELETILKTYNNEVSVVAYSLDNRKVVGFNTESGIFAACTVKAAYALYCLKQMEKGVGSLNTKMTYQEKHYESGTGDLQYSPYGTEFSMKTIISKSLRISDNVGYMMMVDYFGRDSYNEWIEGLGCPSLKIEPTVWSLRTKARDLVVIWREIYNYFKQDSVYSKFLYDSCTNTGNNFLTVSLSDTDYSHKEGHESRGDWLSLSDAGIIWKENSPYIVAIITNAPGITSADCRMFSDVMEIIDKKLF